MLVQLSSEAVRLVYPVLAMVLLSLVVLGALGGIRVSTFGRKHYPKGFFKLMRVEPGMTLPEFPERLARNLINLFEVPVLFYALVPLAILFGVTDDYTVRCLWAFVGFRYLHTLIHVIVNKVPWRFGAYLAATVSLTLAWIHFASVITRQ